MTPGVADLGRCKNQLPPYMKLDVETEAFNSHRTAAARLPERRNSSCGIGRSDRRLRPCRTPSWLREHARPQLHCLGRGTAPFPTPPPTQPPIHLDYAKTQKHRCFTVLNTGCHTGCHSGSHLHDAHIRSSLGGLFQLMDLPEVSAPARSRPRTRIGSVCVCPAYLLSYTHLLFCTCPRPCAQGLCGQCLPGTGVMSRYISKHVVSAFVVSSLNVCAHVGTMFAFAFSIHNGTSVQPLCVQAWQACC